jgi:hypothetical protein
MRVAVVEVGPVAVRSVVAEVTGTGRRRVQDHAIALPLQRPAGAPMAPGAVDLLMETARRLRSTHDRLAVDAVHLVVDEDCRSLLGGLLEDLTEVLAARVAPSADPDEAAALVTAVTQTGAVDGRPTLVVELDATSARVLLVRDGALVTARAVPARWLTSVGAVARPDDPTRWRPVAAAAAQPLLDHLPRVEAVVAAGPGVRSIARLVASRRWRQVIGAADRVTLQVDVLAGVATELANGRGDALPGGLVPADRGLVGGTAVMLTGILEAVGVDAVTASDIQRIDGHVATLLPAPAESLAQRVREVLIPSAYAEQVSRLTTALFDGVAARAGLSRSGRELLEAAALVHDLGRDDGAGHHRRAAVTVMQLPLRGVTPSTLVELACLVRSQRGRAPGGHFAPFTRLAAERRRELERLVALLRLATGMAAAGGQVERIWVDFDDDLVCIHLAGHDLDLALFGARGQARYAEAALDMRLVVRAASMPSVAG